MVVTGFVFAVSCCEDRKQENEHMLCRLRNDLTSDLIVFNFNANEQGWRWHVGITGNFTGTGTGTTVLAN